MSKYGDYKGGYDKENLYDEMKDFMKSYSLVELITVLKDVIEAIEFERSYEE